MKETTQEWINYARADLRNCELVLNEEFLTNILAFHAQQAVEKAFKALMEEKGLIIPRIHSLQRLYDIVEHFIEKEIDINDIALLDSVYTNSRYPADIGLLTNGKPTQKEARELFEKAKKIFDLLVLTINEAV